MKSSNFKFIVSSIIVACTTAQERPENQPSPDYVPPEDNYPMGSGTAMSRLGVKIDSIVAQKNLRGSTFAIPSAYFDVRTVDNCTYPLEVVILQDISDSFSNDMPAMIATELPAMYSTLTATHPGSTFGAVSFSDKPVVPFGWPHQDGYRDDWCYKLEGPLGLDLNGLQSIYDGYILGGGYDYPENQYGVMLSALQAKKIGWGASGVLASRLIVLSTDSPPHYDDDNASDSDRHGMTKYSGVFDEENIDEQCVTEYYPSWQQTVSQLTVPPSGGLGPYVAFLVWDENNQTTATYQWLASQIAENDSFVGSRGQNSTLFWETLSGIIGIIDSLECTGTSSSSSTPVIPTLPTGPTLHPDTPPPTSGETSTVTTSQTTATSPLTDTGCPTEECDGCKEVIVKAPCDAKEVHVNVTYV